MKKASILIVFLFTFILSYGQLTSITAEGTYGYIPSNPKYYKKPLAIKMGIENWFLPRLAIGINGQIFGTTYEYTKSTGTDEEQELNAVNLAYSINIYSKFAFVNNDDIRISVKLEIGAGEASSKPIIYNTNLSSHTVATTNYKKTSSSLLHMGIGIQGQYYLTEKWDVCININYNNYDFSKTLNQMELNSNWNNDFDKTSLLSAGIGFHYYIFGTAKR